MNTELIITSHIQSSLTFFLFFFDFITFISLSHSLLLWKFTPFIHNYLRFYRLFSTIVCLSAVIVDTVGAVAIAVAALTPRNVSFQNFCCSAVWLLFVVFSQLNDYFFQHHIIFGSYHI